MPTGYQNFWKAGTDWYFQRDAINSVEQPWIQFGTINESQPQFNVEQIKQVNFASGKSRTVAQNINSIAERYSVGVANMSLTNLAIALLGNPPEAFTQAADHRIVKHYAHPGKLIKIKDSDADSTPVYRLGIVSGVVKGTSDPAYATKSILSGTNDVIKVSTKLVKLSGNHAAVAALAPGKRFIIASTGLSNIANAITYTVAAIANNGGNTDITTVEAPAQDESQVTGGIIYHASSAVNDLVLDLLNGTDTPDVNKGIFRLAATGDFAASAYVWIAYTKAAYSGNRLIYPQNATGEIQGNFKLIYSRKGNAERTVREGRCSISTTGFGLAPKAYASKTLEVTVLSDTTLARPAGRLLNIKGDLPDFS